MPCSYAVHLTWPDATSLSDTSYAPQALKLESYQHGIHFLNTMTADLDRHIAVDHAESPPTEIVMTCTTPLLVRELYPQVLPYDEILFSFYERKICSTSTFVDNSSKNPYRGMLLPLALRSEAVLDAIHAISARVLALRDPRYLELALAYHSKALQHLNHAIDEISAEDKSIFEACALSMLLCWFEVCFLPQSCATLPTNLHLRSPTTATEAGSVILLA